jgi:hypothetical protein
MIDGQYGEASDDDDDDDDETVPRSSTLDDSNAFTPRSLLSSPDLTPTLYLLLHLCLQPSKADDFQTAPGATCQHPHTSLSPES